MTQDARKPGWRSKKKKAALRPAPTDQSLRESALAALGRRALTKVELARQLDRTISNWAQRARRAGTDPEQIERDVERARLLVEPIVERFVEVGLVNDASFAAMRAERLNRFGRSRRAIEAHLASKGIDEATRASAVARDTESELRAALVVARRKRFGPFATEAEDRDDRRKALATLGRAGFDFDTASRALRMDREEAEERLAHEAR